MSDYPVADLYKDLVSCKRCSISDEAKAPVPFVLLTGKDIMVVGRNPGRTEDEVGLPFVGPGGKALDDWFYHAGLKRSDIIITNLVKCYTSNDRPPKKNEIQECSSRFLRKEIELFKPKVIIPLGKDALHYFLPGTKPSTLQGAWFPMKKYTLFYLHHPGYILRGGYPRKDWLEIGERFGKEVGQYL